MEKLSFRMVMIHCQNENNQHTASMLPKCVGKRLAKEIVHNFLQQRNIFS